MGLSLEELEKASRFKDGMPQCEIVVDGITVAANTVTTSEIDSITASSSSTEAPVYQEATSSPSGASDGSDNIEDQQDSDSSGGGDNGDNSIEDNSSTSEGVASGGNDAAFDETKADNPASDSTTTVDGNTSDESPNPLHFFDMQDCGTFSAMWIWDLALTCSNSTSLDSCSCTAAKIHILYGDIDCMNDECPSDCPVCDMCMKLSGCGPTKEFQRERGAAIEGDNTEEIPIAFIGLTAALFGIQLVLFKMYWGRRTQPGGALGSQLIDQEVV